MVVVSIQLENIEILYRNKAKFKKIEPWVFAVIWLVNLALLPLLKTLLFLIGLFAKANR